jgi:hypothetical protein
MNIHTPSSSSLSQQQVICVSPLPWSACSVKLDMSAPEHSSREGARRLQCAA